MMPSHTGLTSALSSAGAIIGTTMKTISMNSRMKPSRKISTITNTSAVTDPPGSENKNSSTTSSPPSPRKVSENMDAPIRIPKTMQEMRVVLRTTSPRIFQLTILRVAASSMAPTAPNDAASVGVARPPRMDPRTARIRNKGGIRTFTIC